MSVLKLPPAKVTVIPCRTNEISYLGTYIAKSRQFGCSIDHFKKFFFVLPTQYLVKSAGLLLRKLLWSY